MNVIICIPYFNNSHFIDAQIKSFKKFFKNCNWKLCIIDDSVENTINVLSKTKEDVKKACSNYNDDIVYIKFNQNLHNSNNVTDKHCNILNFIVNVLSYNFSNKFDYLCILDADMCLIEDFDVEKEISGYDIISPKRIQWLSNIQISNSPIFEFIWAHCCFFNLNTIKNMNEINLNRIKNTTADTGSMIVEFIHNNPQYKIKYLNFSSGSELIPQVYNFEFFWNRKIIHFGSSTLWGGEQNRFVSMSYQDTFEKFCDICKNGLTYEQNEIIDKTYTEKWFEFHKKFVGVKYTNEDILKYGLCVKI